MLKNISDRQKYYCENCCYRDRTLDNIVFCPYSNKCRKTGKPAEYRIEKGAVSNDGNNVKPVRRDIK